MFNATGDLTSLTYTGQVTPVVGDHRSRLRRHHLDSLDPRIDTVSWVKDEETSHGTSFDGVPGVTDPTDIENHSDAPSTEAEFGSTKAYGYDYAGNLSWVMDRTATSTGITAGVLDGAADPVFPCTQRDYAFDKNGNRASDTSKYAATGECFWGAAISDLRTSFAKRPVRSHLTLRLQTYSASYNHASNRDAR